MTQAEPSTDKPDSVLPQGTVQGPDALAHAIAALLGTARREVRLFAPQLDPAVFTGAAVTGALARFATRHSRNRVRLLVEDRTQLLRDNGRLLDLVRRLADGVELREVEGNDRGGRDLYLIADRSAHLMQEDGGDVVVAARVPHETHQLVERFDAAWERGVPIALRTLGL